MNLEIRVVSQQPPGGRCTLYAGYAEVLAAHLGARIEIEFSTERDAHGSGFPSLLVNGLPAQPADGVILMPADLCAMLAAAVRDETILPGLAEALEAPLERMMEGA
jgi:cystathionine gamma-synthase